MAIETIVWQSVAASPLATIDYAHQAGEEISAGQPLYLDGSNPPQYRLLDASTSATTNYVYAGTAINKAYAQGHPIAVATQDPEFQPGFSPNTADLAWIALPGVPGGVEGFRVIVTGVTVPLYLANDGTSVRLGFARFLTNAEV